MASISCIVCGKVVLSNRCDVCPRASCRVNPYRRCIPGDQDMMRPSMARINLSGEAVSIRRPRPTPFGWLVANRAVPSASFDMPHVPLPGDEFGKHYRKSRVNGASFGIYSDHARRRVGFSYPAEQPRPLAEVVADVGEASPLERNSVSLEFKPSDWKQPLEDIA